MGLRCLEKEAPCAIEQQDYKDGQISHELEEWERTDFAFELKSHRANREDRKAKRDPIQRGAATSYEGIGGNALHDAHHKGHEPHEPGKGLEFVLAREALHEAVREFERVELASTGEVDHARHQAKDAKQRIEEAAEQEGYVLRGKSERRHALVQFIRYLMLTKAW